MALWLVRAGKYGEDEDLALREGRAILGWDDLPDLSGIASRDQLLQRLRSTYPGSPEGRLTNWTSQLWSFVARAKEGDLVVLPLKQRPAIQIGRFSGEYEYVTIGESSTPRHTRPVEWLKELSRSRFSQDLLYSFGAFKTFCQISRNNAEERVRALVEGREPPPSGVMEDDDVAADDEGLRDIEEMARDQIRSRIDQEFGGHNLAHLVAELLRADGFMAHVSPKGPDGGVDIVAAPGSLGFGTPKLVVQVKSGDDPVGTPALNELQGAKQNFGADYGLIVSWGGFRASVERERSKRYFDLRLWNADDLLNELIRLYDHLPDWLQTEIPLKRVWTLVLPQEGDSGG